MASPQLAMDRWVFRLLSQYGGLTSIVGTRIYRDVAPQGATYPFVVFQALASSGTDLQGTPAVTWYDMSVRVVGEAESIVAIDAAAEAVSAALAGQQGSQDGYTLDLWRDGVLGYPETLGGKQFRHMAVRFRGAARASI